MNDFHTVPNPALQDKKAQQTNKARQMQTPVNPSVPHPRQPMPPRQGQPVNAPGRRLPPRTRRKKSKFPVWLLLFPLAFGGLIIMMLVGGMIALQLSFANKILPRVEVAGISVGNMTQAEAIQYLNRQWDSIELSDGDTTFTTNPVELGLTLNVEQSVERAFAQGHGEGGLTAHFQTVNITPVFSVDANTMNIQLSVLAADIEQPARNAGVQFVNGQASATEPVYGTMIDIQGTISNLQSDPSILADGVLELTMLQVAPEVLDSSPLVAEAQSMLSSPLDIRVFDPVTGDSVYWSSMPDVWGNWLTATSDPSSPIGLSLSVDATQVRTYLQNQASANFDSTRSIDLDAAVTSIQSAFLAGTPDAAYAVVQHNERIHTVQNGESITSIAWDYGIPYLYIMQANGGIDSVSVGQQITIPPADFFIEGDVNPNKRIIVSISQQRTYVYENGQLIYEWVSSTGINSSPTWTGVYQILSHEPNAYAGNWNLYMPNFMGVYQPVPGSEFTNGFHGFPTRGGGQLLWENSLGTRVTYGCILLSNTNIRILYDWAEEGVIVEIRA